MSQINRRRFLRGTLAAASLALAPRAVWVAGAEAPERVRGANDTIRIGVIGFNSRGADHIAGLRAVPGARIAALCDVDHAVLDREAAKCRAAGESVALHTDLRNLLADPAIDAVSIATPNHWHSLAAIWAIQAGKDVYVEKPVSHNVWEGRQLVVAARHHARIVQAGTQSRSSLNIAAAFAWLREGHLGRIRVAHATCYKPRPSIGRTEGPQPVPPRVDYDLWCGPAPREPLRRNKLHYDWHWVWPTGNGDLGNQGIHQMDLARWALGEAALSPRILSVGGRLGYADDGTTPNTQIVLHDYPAAPLLFEVRGLPAKPGAGSMDRYHGASIGVQVECEGGWLIIPDDANSARAFDRDGREFMSFAGRHDHGAAHFANFIAAVRSRRTEELHAPVLEGHLSSALCHTGNISHRLGAPRPPEEIREAIRADGALGEALGRMETHLGANLVDLRRSPLTLGVALAMDPRTERFTGNEAANRMLTREYRAPFVVPEIT